MSEQNLATYSNLNSGRRPSRFLHSNSSQSQLNPIISLTTQISKRMSTNPSLKPKISYVFVGETLTPVVVDDVPANPTSVPAGAPATPNNASANPDNAPVNPINNAPANPHNAPLNLHNASENPNYASENPDNTSLYSGSSSSLSDSLEKAQKMPDMSAMRPTGVKVNFSNYTSDRSGSW